jgi:hypothetical protein
MRSFTNLKKHAKTLLSVANAIPPGMGANPPKVGKAEKYFS